MKKRMVKTLAVILIMATVSTMSATIYTVSAAAIVYKIPNGYYFLGDVDATNQVTSGDSRLILRAAVNLETLTSTQRKRADVDQDGKITSSDSRNALRMSVGSDPYIVMCPNSKTYEEKYPYISIVGGLYSPIRAGLYYNKVGYLLTYEQIEEGEIYYFYNSIGGCETKTKPYSPGNEPVILTDYCTFCGAKIDAENALATKTCKHCGADLTKCGVHRCNYCGKSTDNVNGHYACAYGGCLRFLCNGGNCPECGVFVPSGICHTCKN